MAELLRVKCTGGLLIITDTTLIIELRKPKWLGGGLLNKQELFRAQITGTDTHVHTTNGFVDFTFTSAGKELHANLVRPKDAAKVQEVLAEAI